MHETRPCGGCSIPVKMSQTECHNCGLVLTDLDQRIIDINLADIQPSTVTRFDGAKAIAAAARKGLKDLFGTQHKISVTKAGGPHIRVLLPDRYEIEGHGRDQCVRRASRLHPDEPIRQCRHCDRHHRAVETMRYILVRIVPGTENRSDSQSDYYDFIWMVA